MVSSVLPLGKSPIWKSGQVLTIWVFDRIMPAALVSRAFLMRRLWFNACYQVPRPWDFPLLAEPPTSRVEDNLQTATDLVSTPATLLGVASAQSPVPSSPAVPIKSSA